MVAKPSQDFVAPRLLWKIGRDIDERDATVPSAEETGGIVTPGGRQNDLCFCSLQGLRDVRDLSKSIRQELEKFFIATDELEDKKLEIVGW